jgi:hypothetical protein
MCWTLDKNGVTPRVTLTKSEQDKLNDFMRRIQKGGVHPSEAASAAGCEYKRLRGPCNQYEIYLSKGNRATFTVNEVNHRVTFLQVGGHT